MLRIPLIVYSIMYFFCSFIFTQIKSIDCMYSTLRIYLACSSVEYSDGDLHNRLWRVSCFANSRP